MPKPKRKHTRSRRDSRRSNNSKLVAAGSSKCPQCGASKQPHCICKACGFYNGTLVVPKKEKKKTEGTEGAK
jgi:large subunit ribosomal protein L32